jgi:cell division protein FtsW (lipid II flippase)
MYSTLLALHSLVRWLVLTSLLLAIFFAYYGWLSKKRFTRMDNAIRHWTATIAHIQLILGLWLYFISPIVAYFLSHFNTAMHERAIRFFGMEHITMMLIGITIITIGSAKAKRKTTDHEKFKTMAIWFTIALLVILSSVPWSFSPLISRPNFRPF